MQLGFITKIQLFLYGGSKSIDYTTQTTTFTWVRKPSKISEGFKMCLWDNDG